VLRNIDFEALRSLRDRHGAAFPRGRVIVREGDTSAEFYVVLQGAVEVSIKDPRTGAKHVLSVLQPGSFFGEMSCFSGLPRSATATAAEDSVLLFFNQDTAIQLMRASPLFALGVIQTLCDRIRNNNERIAQLSALVGDLEKGAAAPATSTHGKRATAASPALAATAAAAASAARRTTPGAPPIRDVAPVDYNKALFWGRPVVCPVSNTRFLALNVRPEVSQVKARDTDFREIVTGPNPLHYLVYVCPECGYAAYADDFATASGPEVGALAGRTAERQAAIGSVTLAGERTIDQAILSLRLAVDCYLLRAPNGQKLGGVYHRLAWLYREAGDPERERGYLAQAIEQYRGAVEEGELSGAAEVTLLYTIGDLYLRLDRPADAVKWLQRASQHPDFRSQPEIGKLLRERWTAAREATHARS
jgi:CRP-like cAMP-binding protein/uncharacterized protein (DUF2225 family)